MTKLCPRGKAAAKRKFDVYPSAYANAYASKICAGKIKDPSGVKRKDFRGPKPAKAMGGRIFKREGGSMQDKAMMEKFKKQTPVKKTGLGKPKDPRKFKKPRERVKGYMGGGMAMPRAMYGKGGGVCKKGMGRAYGRNS
jgi:hypothetical protein